MDYENKYKEALATAKHYYEELDSDTTKNVLEEIFPELQEEESERIRKELLDFLHQLDIQGYTDWRYNSWVAWLEKQGEHANFLSKIQVGDKVTRNEDGMLVNLSQLKRVAKKDEKYGEQKQWDSVKSVSEEDKLYLMPDEQKPTTWSEEDENIIKELINDLESILGTANGIDKNTHGYSVEKLKEQIDWLKSLNDRVQPKQEWSEEDKSVLEDIKVAVTSYWNEDTENIILDWLKSLRPHNWTNE